MRPAAHKPRARVEEVLDAAVALLDAEGEAALGWNRLAQALGVKPPSLYNHLADAADLRRRVAIRGWQALAEATRAATARTRTPETTLRAIAGAYRDVARTRPGLFVVATGTRIPPGDPDFQPVAAELMAMLTTPLEQLGVPPARRVHAIRILRAAIHGFLELERTEVLAMEASIDQSFRLMLDVVLAGLRELQG